MGLHRARNALEGRAGARRPTKARWGRGGARRYRGGKGAARKGRVLDEAVAAQVLAQNGGVASELRHEAEGDAGGHVDGRGGRGAPAAPLRRFVRHESERRPERAVELLLDLLHAVRTTAADGPHMELAALLGPQARASAAGHAGHRLHRLEAHDRHAGGVGRHDAREHRRGVGRASTVGPGGPSHLRLGPVPGEGEPRQVWPAQHVVHGGRARRLRHQLAHRVVTGLGADAHLELDRQSAAGHGAVQGRALHGVAVVLHEDEVADGEAPRPRHVEHGVHPRRHHAHGHERERAGRGVEAVEVRPLVAGQPPRPAGGRPDDGLLLHARERPRPDPDGLPVAARRPIQPEGVGPVDREEDGPRVAAEGVLGAGGGWTGALGDHILLFGGAGAAVMTRAGAPRSRRSPAD